MAVARRKNQTIAVPSSEHVLWEGRHGEKIVELKADNADNICVLAAFILSFTISYIFGLDGSEHPLLVALASASAGAGISCVLLLTFLSLKVRRLRGRSVFRWGEDCDMAQLPEKMVTQLHAPTKDGKADDALASVRHAESGEVRFYARAWYYANGHQGPAIYLAGISCLKAQLALFTAAASCILLLRFQYGGGLAAALLVLPPLLAWRRLQAARTFDDLA